MKTPSRPAGLAQVWRYRHFIRSTIVTEFRARFSRSLLGSLWMIIHPLAMAAIYAVVLSAVLRAKIPGASGSPYDYAIYLLAGLLLWTVFSEAVMRGMNLFSDNASLIKAVNFPKICLPIAGLGSVLVNGLILFTAIMLICFVTGFAPNMQWIIVPAWLALVGFFAMSLGLVLGVLRVFFPDIGEVVPIILQLFFWLTPIVYPLSIVGAPFDRVIAANPLTPIVGQVQAIFLGLPIAGPKLFLVVFGVSVLLAVIALWLYRRTRADLVDLL